MGGGLKGGRIGFADRVLVNRAPAGLVPTGVARLRGVGLKFSDLTITKFYHAEGNTP